MNPKDEQPRNGEPSDAKAFFNKREPWSRVKHEVLSRYLDLYVSKVGFHEPHLYFVDGFAGCGEYDDGAIGSPLIAAMKSTKPITHSRAGKLRCIFVEADPNNAADLQSALDANCQGLDAKIIHEKFDPALPQILKLVGNAPAFFFIDPFGFQSVGLDVLKSIRGATNIKSEVLLRFDDIYFKRMVSFASKHAENVNSAKIQKAAQNFASKCNAVLGTGWSAATESSREEIVRAYCALVRDEGLFKFGISYPIKNPETNGHHYFLVHFSNFEDGYIFMADFMGQIERSIAHRDTGIFPEFEPNPILGVIIDDAVKEQDKKIEKENIQNILEHFRTLDVAKWKFRSGLKRRHFYAAAVDKFGYSIRLKESRKALTSWLEEINGRSDGTNESSSVFLP